MAMRCLVSSGWRGGEGVKGGAVLRYYLYNLTELGLKLRQKTKKSSKLKRSKNIFDLFFNAIVDIRSHWYDITYWTDGVRDAVDWRDALHLRLLIDTWKSFFLPTLLRKNALKVIKNKDRACNPGGSISKAILEHKNLSSSPRNSNVFFQYWLIADIVLLYITLLC